MHVRANFNLWFEFWIVVESHSDDVDSLIQCQTLSVLGKNDTCVWKIGLVSAKYWAVFLELIFTHQMHADELLPSVT